MNMNIKMYETKMRSYRNGEEGKEPMRMLEGWSGGEGLKLSEEVFTTPTRRQNHTIHMTTSYDMVITFCLQGGRVGGRSTC